MCDFSSSHFAHGQSCNTNTHDKHNIKAEKINNHGSIQSGINEVCEISGANKPIKDNTMGKTQQNKCGSTDANKPNLTALFFITYPFFENKNLASPAEFESASNP